MVRENIYKSKDLSEDLFGNDVVVKAPFGRDYGKPDLEMRDTAQRAERHCYLVLVATELVKTVGVAAALDYLDHESEAQSLIFSDLAVEQRQVYEDFFEILFDVSKEMRDSVYSYHYNEEDGFHEARYSSKRAGITVLKILDEEKPDEKAYYHYYVSRYSDDPDGNEAILVMDYEDATMHDKAGITRKLVSDDLKLWKSA